jgi:predicted RNase H-like HicB family nuclease
LALRFYQAIAFRAPGDGPDDGWDVIFPDFPGCISQGDTAQEAMEHAVEALALHIDGMVAEGLPLPAPSGMNEPLPDWIEETDMAAPVQALLPMDVPGKSKRINITLDEALVERVDTASAPPPGEAPPLPMRNPMAATLKAFWQPG